MEELFEYVKYSMTYDEYVFRILCIVAGFIVMIITQYYVFFVSFYSSKRKGFFNLSKLDQKKFRAICKIEGLPKHQVISEAIEQCIKIYENKHKIDLEDYI